MLPSRRNRTATARTTPVRPPDPHPSGARPPDIPIDLVPKHIALVMDGNGRWANQRGLPRIEGHKRGEAVRVDELDELGVRIRWAGRQPRMWRSVVNELKIAEERTRGNKVLNLTMCVNYGGRAELGDAAREIARLVAAGKINPDKVDERTLARHMYQPDMPDVDLFVRPSGEERTSNFLLWQSAYAELVFQDILWPDFDRLHLWRACEHYANRSRRFGAATDLAESEEAR